MTPEPLNTFEKICARINAAMPPDTVWRWDKQYRTALTILSEQAAEPLLERLADEFQHKWDYLTIENASETMYQFFTGYFGIIPGQQVFSCEMEELILFAVIWPWGDGGACSVRIGIYSRNELIYGDWSIRKLLIKWFDPKEMEQDAASWVIF